MDDFVIPAKIIDELKEQMICFLKIVKKHSLCFKRLKCDFNMKEILIIGVVVGKRQVQIENNKVKVIKKWKSPTKIKKVESFLWFVNFYRQFIKNFNYIARPLNKLKEKKDQKQEEEYQKAFEELKDKITSQLVLTLPKREGKFQVEIDASEYAIEEMLSQEQDGKQKPIMFLSRTI